MPRPTGDFYQKYLKSPQWEAKRQTYFAVYGKWCKACKKSTGPIQLHHMTYERLGRESLRDLTSLCPACHANVKKYQRQGFGLREATAIVLRRRV